MSKDIIIHRKDDVHFWIEADSSIIQELAEYFTFKAENYKYHPLFKARKWDGNIRLLNIWDKQLYVGLIYHLLEFAKNNKYSVNADSIKDYMHYGIEPKEIVDFAKSLKLSSDGNPITPRDYQYFGVWYSINNLRAVIVSPTSSGKSLMIYMLLRFYQTISDKKILIIVPTVSLVNQMYADFDDYATLDNTWNVTDNCHKIMEGQSKVTDKQIVISTWQSIYKEKQRFFNQFGSVIGDECHGFKAKSLGSIMNKLKDCPFRIGTTGTTGSKTINKLTLQGHFGRIKKIISTKELMDRKEIATLKIKCVHLSYTDEERKEVKKLDYQKEVKYINKHKRREEFLVGMVNAMKGNTLILFNHKDHGKRFLQALKDSDTGKALYYVDGDVDKELREQYRLEINKLDGADVVASYGTFSTGINIPNINQILTIGFSKSEIRTLQSIGRGLRKSGRKDTCTLWDIVDDLTWKKHNNYAVDHFIERVEYYNKEQFDYTTVKFDL